MKSNDVFTIEGFKNVAQYVARGESIPEKIVKCDKKEFIGALKAGSDLFFLLINGVLVCLCEKGGDFFSLGTHEGKPVIMAKFSFSDNENNPMLLICGSDFYTIWDRIGENIRKSSTAGWMISYAEDDRGNKVSVYK